MRIDPDGKVTFTIPQVEMGQGIYTALSMILAEELDAPFDHVTAVAAPPNDKLYANPLLGFQVTGGSTSVRAFWKPMRIAGAAARAMLVQAAAAKWSVDPSSCRTESGEVVHDASAQKAAYGELVQAAAALTPPQNPPLKPAANFKLIGKSLKRLDTPDKVNGKAVYGIDARPAGVKIATLASCPVFGGKVAHVNDERAKTMPGVRQVIVLDDLVAVVGDHMWAAKQGLDALDITWDEGPNADVSTADVLNGLVTASEKARRGREIDRRRRQGPGRGNESRGDLSRAVPRPCADGADELHRARSSRRLRDLGRQSGHHPRARDRGEGDGSAAREGDRPQSSDRRRLRPAARSRLYRQGRAHRAEGRRAGEGHLDARGGHPAGALPTVLF